MITFGLAGAAAAVSPTEKWALTFPTRSLPSKVQPHWQCVAPPIQLLRMRFRKFAINSISQPRAASTDSSEVITFDMREGRRQFDRQSVGHVEKGENQWTRRRRPRLNGV